MNSIIFDKLKDKIELDTDNDKELIGCSAKHNKYEISFFAEESNNYILVVENFGRMFRGNWVEDEPTEEQLEEMQKIINQKVIDVTNAIEEQNRIDNYDNSISDPYDYYGVSKESFY
jgi:hypothetical protein